MRLLAVLIPARDPALQGVPTAKEQGFDASLEAWRGIAAPRGIPRQIIATLEAAIRTTVASTDFQKSSENLGVRPGFMPADEFGELIAREDAALARVMSLINFNR